MPVKAYVQRDSAGRAAPPSFSHETQALIEIVKRLWSAFQPAQDTFAVVANLQEEGMARADLAIVGERGLGVVELKHYSGVITRVEDAWYASGHAIRSGRHANPHAQVQAYAADLRALLLQMKPEWQQAERKRQTLRVHTAVCFTHPNVYLDDFRRWLVQAPVTRADWEVFTVLKPAEAAEWTAGVSFEKSAKSELPGMGYEPYRLTPAEIERFVSEVLGATEWLEMASLLPTAEPYGLLALIEHGQPTTLFRLDRDEIVIGRDPRQCHIAVPGQYTLASKRHARLRRQGGEVLIEDLDSSNGTYVAGRRVHPDRVLAPGQAITLGGPAGGEKVCVLHYWPADEVIVDRTERAAVHE